MRTPPWRCQRRTCARTTRPPRRLIGVPISRNGHRQAHHPCLRSTLESLSLVRDCSTTRPKRTQSSSFLRGSLRLPRRPPDFLPGAPAAYRCSKRPCRGGIRTGRGTASESERGIRHDTVALENCRAVGRSRRPDDGAGGPSGRVTHSQVVLCPVCWPPPLRAAFPCPHRQQPLGECRVPTHRRRLDTSWCVWAASNPASLSAGSHHLVDICRRCWHIFRFHVPRRVPGVPQLFHVEHRLPDWATRLVDHWLRDHVLLLRFGQSVVQ